MLDKLGREINYMRISVTDRCNFRCRYCMPPEGTDWKEREEILRYEEILEIVRAAVRLGITHFRVTGGEPFARRGVMGFLRELAALPGVEAVSVTTNGSLLGAHLEELKEMGINGINVSLDTLDREQFFRLTGKDELDAVVKAIERAAAMGFDHLKVNCVPMRGVNEEDLCDLAALARDKKLDVRFIELMPVGCGREFQMIPQDEVLERLERRYGPIAWEREGEGYGRGPAVYGRLNGFRGAVGFISAMSRHFCSRCSRIRLLSDGGVKGCLYYPAQVNLREFFRGGASGEELERALARVIWEKPAGHRWGAENPDEDRRELSPGREELSDRTVDGTGQELMSSIGG